MSRGLTIVKSESLLLLLSSSGLDSELLDCRHRTPPVRGSEKTEDCGVCFPVASEAWDARKVCCFSDVAPVASSFLDKCSCIKSSSSFETKM